MRNIYDVILWYIGGILENRGKNSIAVNQDKALKDGHSLSRPWDMSVSGMTARQRDISLVLKQLHFGLQKA